MDGSRKEGMTSQSPNRRRGTSRRLMCPLAFSTPEEESTWLREGEGDETEEKKRQLLLSPSARCSVWTKSRIRARFASSFAIFCQFIVFIVFMPRLFCLSANKGKHCFWTAVAASWDDGFVFYGVNWKVVLPGWEKPHAEKQNKLIFESILATTEKSWSTNNLCGRWMCPARGSCCFLPGPQFNTGGQRGCWYPCFLQCVPPPLRHVTCVGWPSAHNSQKPRAGPFFFFFYKYKLKTQHMYIQLKERTLCSVTCSPATSLFLGRATVGSVSAVSSHNKLCRLSVWTFTAGQQLTLLVSTPNWLPVVPPPCSQKHLLTQCSGMSTRSCPNPATRSR